MTKILVDELPKDPEDCPFVEHVWTSDGHRCKLGPVMKRCVLNLHEECDKLEAMENGQ